jgi:Skp family chaperone for outer membrane proteins
MSKKKGGNKAGLASSGNELGDKTAMLSSSNKMNITGQESPDGEVDIETEKAQESEQKAVREYRQNADKYEALKESALESESIPLGHRQTIRKYFEMIRPTNNTSSETGAEAGATEK